MKILTKPEQDSEEQRVREIEAGLLEIGFEQQGTCRYVHKETGQPLHFAPDTITDEGHILQFGDELRAGISRRHYQGRLERWAKDSPFQVIDPNDGMRGSSYFFAVTSKDPKKCLGVVREMISAYELAILDCADIYHKVNGKYPFTN